jgi:nucleoside-diphosphate-sugar epimerase
MIVREDVSNPYDVMKVLAGERIEYVYHTAGYPGFTIGCQMNPYAAIQVNVVGLVNMLEAVRLHPVKTLLFTSSSVLSAYVHPAADGASANKEYAYPRPSTIYSSTKLAGENFGLNYAEAYGVDFVAVRFAAVFGPWRYGGGGGPSALIRDMVTKSMKKEPVTVASSNFEYVYSKDAARGAVLACHSKRKDRVFNIGMGGIFELREIAALIKEVVPTANITVTEDWEKKAPTETSDNRSNYRLMPDPDFNQALDLTRSTQQIGYKPMYTMKAALEDYVSCLKAMGV